MGVYFRDKVEITPITRNAKFRTETEGVKITAKAYYEDETKISRNNFGEQINQQAFLFLPTGTSIFKGDYVRLTELRGTTILLTSDLGRLRKVAKVFPVGSFKTSHLEVEFESVS
jgi:hypothetical protein